MATKQDSAWPGVVLLVFLLSFIPGCFSDDEEAPEPSSNVSTEYGTVRSSLTSEAPGMEAANDYVAAIINLNGHLCAQVVNVVPRGGSDFEVTCTEYRSGSGSVRYLVNGEVNTARRL